MTDTHRTYTGLARWLLFVMALVVAMIVLGGATRLTNSGLSITEWKPITGALPPLSHEAWQAEYEKYKQIPEFMAEHPGMDLKAFEFIYFMEWSHRQLGRLIGLAYGLPFLLLAFRKKLPAVRFRRFLAVLLLIGCQGAIGWWMVASGLVNDRVDVSPYRLSVHLGMAFIILGMLYGLWRDMREGMPPKRDIPLLGKLPTAIFHLTFLQILVGAFVAGNHAGKTYNTWPLMDGGLVPNGYGIMSPFWRNLFENIGAIQFNHRLLAYIIFGCVCVLMMRAVREKKLIKEVGHLFGVTLWQVGLGIWTLLAVAPLNLSLLHQFSAILLFLTALWVRRASRYSAASESVRSA